MMDYVKGLHLMFGRFLTLFSLLAVSTSALASGTSGGMDIKSVIQRECTSQNRGFELILAADHTNPDSCSVATRVSISCDHLAFNQLVSMSLAATMADKQVVAWLNGCNDDGKALVTALTIVK